MVIQDLIVRFLDHLEIERNYSAHTRQAYTRDLNQFSEFLHARSDDEGLVHPGQIDKSAIRSFLGYLNQKSYSKRTVARRFAAIRSWFHYLHRESIITSNPTLYLTSPRLDQRLPKFLDQSQIETLMDLPDRTTVLGTRDAALIELLYGTGMRLSELVDLNVQSVDFTGERIRVLGKGEKERIVPLGGHALAALQVYIQTRENLLKKGRKTETSLFVNQQGKRLTGRGVQKILDRYAMEIGEEHLSPHTLRHTAATHLLDAGADLIAVKEILGHERLSTTQVYTHVALDRLKRTYEKAHPRS